MNGPVLLYDGDCALCSGSVRFVLRHERCRHLRFAPLDGAFAGSVLSRRAGLAGLDTIVWYEPAEADRPERILTRSAAVLEVLRYIQGPWAWMARLTEVVPRQVLDAAYRLLARSRRRLFGRSVACALPPSADRDRFLA